MAERKTVIEAINNRQILEVIYAESFPATNLPPKQVCLGKVKNCDIYIGIFKNRYGYIPREDNPRGFSVPILEYYEAKSNGLLILIFIDKHPNNLEAKLKNFLDEIMDFDKGHFVKCYSDLNELGQVVLGAIDNEIGRGFVETRMRMRKKQQLDEIYNLPYFEKLKENL